VLKANFIRRTDCPFVLVLVVVFAIAWDERLDEPRRAVKGTSGRR
jgi:hypothetical protein